MSIINTVPHGLAKSGGIGFVRTDPKTMDKIVEQMDTKKPMPIYHDLKKDNSMTCTRDYQVIRSKKYHEKKKDNPAGSKANVADEVQQIWSSLNAPHPFIKAVHGEIEKVPFIICFTKEQILDLKDFLSQEIPQPLGIDRTFNLGSFYVTTMVYKNHRVVRKNTNDHPIFLGPIMLHKDATKDTYVLFLQRVCLALDSGPSPFSEFEVRVSENLEFGSDEELALTNAIDYVFPSANRYLCTKHLKDNIKHHMQNKVGMEQSERGRVMDSLFGAGKMIDAESTFDFDSQADTVLAEVSGKYPVFSDYLQKRFIPNVREHVFLPQRRNPDGRLWTNNNAESINNIIKNSVDWKPTHTRDLIEKLYGITNLHFMNYRSALHDCGNYRLTYAERNFRVNDHVWRCKSEEQKVKHFSDFLRGIRKDRKETYVTSSDGKFKVPIKAKGTAKKPGQKRRPPNERTKKR